MSKRLVLKQAFGEPGYERALAAILDDIVSGDIIVVPDAQTEKGVRMAVKKLGLGDPDVDDVGIGIELLPPDPTEEEVSLGALEYAPLAEDEKELAAELEEVMSYAHFDPMTVFVVADRHELEAVFQVAKKLGLFGTVRATIERSNVIVTALEEIVESPKPELTFKLDPEMLSDAVLRGLEKGGFAVGFRPMAGKLGYWIQEHTVSDPKVIEALGRMEIILTGKDGVSMTLGAIGDEIRIAVSLLPAEMPKFKIGVKKTEDQPVAEGEEGVSVD